MLQPLPKSTMSDLVQLFTLPHYSRLLLSPWRNAEEQLGKQGCREEGGVCRGVISCSLQQCPQWCSWGTEWRVVRFLPTPALNLRALMLCPELELGSVALAWGLVLPVKGTWKGFSPTSMCSFRLADGPLRPLSHGICPSLCISPWTEKGLGYLRTNFVNSLQLLTLLAVGRTPSGHRPHHW